jgi:hypothetical protein
LAAPPGWEVVGRFHQEPLKTLKYLRLRGTVRPAGKEGTHCFPGARKERDAILKSGYCPGLSHPKLIRVFAVLGRR